VESPGVTFGAHWSVTIVDRTGSTNADLVAAAAAGAPDGTVLVARHQSAGRGRLDRVWEAPPGANLLVSIVFRPLPQRPQRVTWLVALAARRACREIVGTEARLKWPNDLVADDAKLAGLLAQVVGDAAVVGLGLNVGWAPAGAARLGDGVDPILVLRHLLSALDDLVGCSDAELLTRCREASATVGRRVRAELPGGAVLEGRAVDLEQDGRLVVLDDCALTHRLDVADVVHLRTPSVG